MPPQIEFTEEDKFYAEAKKKERVKWRPIIHAGLREDPVNCIRLCQ